MVVVTITKKGFEPVTVNVVPQVSTGGSVGLAGNVLLGGLPGVAIDAMSGSMNSLVPNPIDVKLVMIDQLKMVAKKQQSNQKNEVINNTAKGFTPTLIGKWCDLQFSGGPNSNETIEIRVSANGQVVLSRIDYQKSTLNTFNLQEKADNIYVDSQSNSGEKYRITPRTSDLQILDETGLKRTAKRLLSGEC